LPAGFVLDKERGELITAVEAAIETTIGQAKTAWLATFAPPLVLLGLGLCVAWILRGFRPQKRASTT
jgi:hypothetical protein